MATRLTRAETKKDTTGGYTFNPCGNKKRRKNTTGGYTLNLCGNKKRQVATRLTRAETKNIKKTGGYTLNPCVNIRSLWNSSRPTYLVKGFGVVRLLARSRNTWGPFKNLEPQWMEPDLDAMLRLFTNNVLEQNFKRSHYLGILNFKSMCILSKTMCGNSSFIMY